MLRTSVIRMRRLVIVMIALRVGATLVLGLGPATDSPAELQGWDGARFHEIATEPGRPWVDHDVEYPPGTVFIAEMLTLGSDDVVDTNRRLVFASLVVDLALAGLLAIRVGHRQAVTYLALGTLMIPMGLLRLDLWAAFAATVAMIELVGVRGRSSAPSGVGDDPRPGTRQTIVFAVSVTIGWLIKVFPALLIPVAIGIRSLRAALASMAASLVAVGAWVAFGGIDAIDQVISLRGATGWHLESIPGSIVALVSDDPPRLEANAYRIGTLDTRLVLAGRIGFLAILLALAWLAGRCIPARRGQAAVLMMLGSLAALLVTAPLLSPQFLLWLAPFAALVVDDRSDLRRPEIVLTASAMALTSVVLAAFGPPDLDRPLAASLLLLRDVALVALVVSCARSIQRLGPGRATPVTTTAG